MRWLPLIVIFVVGCQDYSFIAIQDGSPGKSPSESMVETKVIPSIPSTSEPFLAKSLPTNTLYYVNLSMKKLLPKDLTVYEGDAVMWVNRDDTSHRIHGAGFESDILYWAGHYTYIFDRAGNYPYQCDLHSYEHGTIRVLAVAKEFSASGANIFTVNVTQKGFFPSQIRIAKGDVVIWHNYHPDSSITVSGAGFDSGSIRYNGRFSYQFNRPGIYPYGSTFQNNFYGNVTVLLP